MQFGYGLYQQQTQKLIMTPELRQAITMLQFSAIELTDFLHQEMVENPVFEIDEREFERYDLTSNNYFKTKTKVFSLEEELNIWDTIATPQANLEAHLMEQARFLSLSDDKLKIIEYLIGCLDDDGYLKVSLSDIADHFKVNVSIVEDVLAILQSFDPVGVGARNLQENLLLQLNQMEASDPLAIQIVKYYLKDLGEHRFNKIAHEMNISVKEVQQVFDLIKTLKPKPAIEFNRTMPKYIIPDVIIEEVEGNYVVLVNDSFLPSLKINPDYKQYIQKQTQDETAKYLIEKYNSAKWLIKSIDQRKATLYNVTSAIFKFQRTFLQNQNLKPLTLKEIAEEIGVHESTVSRAVNQKYVQTPIGIFELKYFFTTGLSTDNGETTSAENVKRAIQELVDNEDKKKPFSDQGITELLNEKGINISRRTVAKYRDELGIPSSSSRRRYD